jgi:hypothetical protein
MDGNTSKRMLAACWLVSILFDFPSRMDGVEGTKTWSLGGCKGIEFVKEPFEAARANPNILYMSTIQNFALIDYAYSIDRNGHRMHFGIQVTKGKQHSADPDKILELIGKVGSENLQIHQMVQDKNYNAFVTKPVNPAPGILWISKVPDPPELSVSD